VKLTVVVPTHNRSHLLGQCLRGLLDQTLPADQYEVVVVDDGSTDDTLQVVKEVGAPASRLRSFHQENKGPAAARNYGTREARGGLILFTGDDCLPDKHLLAEHVDAHESGGDVGVVGHIAWHPDLEVTPFMSFLEQGVQFDFGDIEDPGDVSFWYCYSSNLSLPRRRLEEVGGFDEDFKHAAWEDIELGYRLRQRGLRLVYRSGAITYHFHPTTLERYLERQLIAGRAAVTFYRKHPELMEDLGIGHAARPVAARTFYDAALQYAFSVGVREALREDGRPEPDESQAVRPEGRLQESGRAWIHDVFGGDDPVREELEDARRQLQGMRKLRQEFEWVTSRRLYRTSEALAKWAWRTLTRLGYRRRPKGD
jgi:glycosyltransferase involved in cell wall biosynthesis